MLEFFRMARAERKFENTGKSFVELVREGWKKAGGKAIYNKKLQCKEELKYQVVFERKYDSAIAAELACRMEPWVMSFLRGREIDFSTIDSHIAYGFFNFIKTCRIEYTDKITGEIKETHLFDTDKSIVTAIQNSIKCKIDQSNRKEIFKYRLGYTGTGKLRNEKISELKNILDCLISKYFLDSYKYQIYDLYKKVVEANAESYNRLAFYLDENWIGFDDNGNPIRVAKKWSDIPEYQVLVKEALDNLNSYLSILEIVLNKKFKIEGITRKRIKNENKKPKLVKEKTLLTIDDKLWNWRIEFFEIGEKYKEVCKETSYNEPIYGKGDEESGEIGDFIQDVEPTPEDRCIERDEVNQLCIKYSENEFGKILLEIIIDSGSSGKLSIKDLKEIALSNSDFRKVIAQELEFTYNPEDDFELSGEQEEKLYRKIKLFYRGLRKRLKTEFQLN